MSKVFPRGPGVNIPWNHAEVNATWYQTATDKLECSWACDFKHTNKAFVPMAWELRQGFWPGILHYANLETRSEHMMLLWNEPNVSNQSNASPQECANTIHFFDSKTGCSWAGPVALWHYNGESWLDAYYGLGGKWGTIFAVDIYAVSLQHFREQWDQIKRAIQRWKGHNVAVVIQEFAHLYYPSQISSGAVTYSDTEDMQLRLIDEVFELAERDGQLYGWGYFSGHYSTYEAYYRPTDLLDAKGNLTRVGRHWNMIASDYISRHDYLPIVSAQ